MGYSLRRDHTGLILPDKMEDEVTRDPLSLVQPRIARFHLRLRIQIPFVRVLRREDPRSSRRLDDAQSEGTGDQRFFFGRWSGDDAVGDDVVAELLIYRWMYQRDTS